MRTYPKTNKNVVIPFITALINGNPETSNDPSIPWGRGPRIKNATAPVMTTEII